MNDKLEILILIFVAFICAVIVYFAVKNQNKQRITQEQIFTKYCDNKHWSIACEELQLNLTKN